MDRTEVADLQKLLLVKTSEELQPFVDKAPYRTQTSLQVALMVTLCLHPLLTVAQALSLHRRSIVYTPYLAENAGIRLELQTHPDYLSSSPQAKAVQSLERHLQEAQGPTLQGVPVREAAKSTPWAAPAQLLEEAGRLSLEETNLLARILLVYLSTPRTVELGPSAIPRLLQPLLSTLPLELYRGDTFLHGALRGALSYYMLTDEGGHAYDLLTEVLGERPEANADVWRTFVSALGRGQTACFGYEERVPCGNNLAPELLENIAEAVLYDACRKTPLLHPESPLVAWSLQRLGVAGLLRVAHRSGSPEEVAQRLAPLILAMNAPTFFGGAP